LGFTEIEHVGRGLTTTGTLAVPTMQPPIDTDNVYVVVPTVVGVTVWVELPVAVIIVPSVAVQVVTTGVIVPGSPSPSSDHALVAHVPMYLNLILRLERPM